MRIFFIIKKLYLVVPRFDIQGYRYQGLNKSLTKILSL